MPHGLGEPRHGVRERAPARQAACRDVHRHRQVEAGVAPRALLAQRLVEHPRRQRPDQLAALRLGHEVARASAGRAVGCCQRTSASTPVVRCVPSGRSWAGSAARARRAGCSRAARSGGSAGARSGPPGSAAKTARPLPDSLGLMHRQVGPAQQVGGGAAVLREEGDADARPHVDDVAADHERAARTPRGSSRRRPPPSPRRSRRTAGCRTRRRPGAPRCPSRASRRAAVRRPP